MELPNENLGPKQDLSRSKRRFWFIFVLSLVLFAFAYLYLNKQNLFPKIGTENKANGPDALPISASLVFSESDLEKVEMVPGHLPKSFPTEFPLYPQATIIESFELFDSPSQKIKQVTVVFSTPDSLSKIQSFYKEKLVSPEFGFIQGSDSQDTEQNKALAFFTETKLVIVLMEQMESFSSLTIKIRDLDTLIPADVPSPAPSPTSSP